MHGFIALLMDLPSIAALKEIVQDFIEWYNKRLSCRPKLPALETTAMLDALDVGIVILDRGARVVVWNDWMARHAGVNCGGGGQTWSLFPGLAGTRLPAAIEHSFVDGASSILTHSLNKLLPLHDETGKELLHNAIIRPIAAGPAQQCLLQINDVTVAVTRERVLRERQNARYRAIVDTAPDMIIPSTPIFRSNGSMRRPVACSARATS